MTDGRLIYPKVPLDEGHRSSADNHRLRIKPLLPETERPMTGKTLMSAMRTNRYFAAAAPMAGLAGSAKFRFRDYASLRSPTSPAHQLRLSP